MAWVQCCGPANSGAYIEFDGDNYGNSGSAIVCCTGGATPSLNTSSGPTCIGYSTLPPTPPATQEDLCALFGGSICRSDSSSCTGDYINVESVPNDGGAFPDFCQGEGSWSVVYEWIVVYYCTCGGNTSYSSEEFSFTLTYTNDVPPCASGEPGGEAVYSKIARFADWNFTIPENAEIIGIEAEVAKQAETTDKLVSDSIVKLMKNHRITGKNKADLETPWSNRVETKKYGDLVDTWGLSDLTSSDINSNGFGLAIEIENASNRMSSNAFLTEIQINVFYKIDDEVFSQNKIKNWDGAVYPLFD